MDRTSLARAAARAGRSGLAVLGLTMFAAATGHGQVQPLGVAEQVSLGQLLDTIQAINFDRTSGREGERRAAVHLEEKLTSYDIRHTRHDVRAYLSWPVRAELAVVGSSRAIRAVTPAFGGSTGPEGITAELYWEPDEDEDSSLPAEAAGKIVVASGLVSPQSVLRAQRAGAAGLIHVNGTDVLHEMIATTIWGTPTTVSTGRLPAIPVVSIGRTAGDRLRASRTSRVRLVTEVQRAWSTIPLVVAEVPGRTLDFILVATHLDAWYEGMTDTAGTVASVLEMARVLQGVQPQLKRGFRFAWWPGHSFGRYAGSTWYADHFWAELDRHAVAYTNLDGAGRRGSQMEAVYARGWPGLLEFSRSFAERQLGKTPPPPPNRLFRPGRDSDSAFQGLGIPEFAVGVPGPPPDHPDVTESGRIAYWHTREDTLDKLDLKALEVDTRYRVAQLYELATLPVLPHRIAPIASSYQRALEELERAAGSSFDLTSTRAAATRLQDAATRLDGAPRPGTAAEQAALDRLLVRVTHRLNARLYTRAGRFDQDPAAPVPILPLLARARELPALDPASDEYGFLETELVRGRNAVEHTLREATTEMEDYLSSVASR